MVVSARRAVAARASAAPYRPAEAEELAEIGSWQMDLATGELTITPGMRRHMGVGEQSEDPTPQTYFEAVHPEDRERAARQWRDLIRKGCEYRSEHRLLLRGGQLKYVRTIGRLERDEQGQAVRAYGLVQDITDLRLAALDVEGERDLSRAILSSLQEGYLLLHASVIVEVNEALCAMTRFSRGELIGTSAPYRFATEGGNELVPDQRAPAAAHGETRLRRSDGSLVAVAFTATPVRPDRLASPMWVVMVRDITAQREYERHLITRAESDPLTGLPNSRTFRDRLRVATASWHQGSALSLAMIDVDHFKQINDRFGHCVGDQVLLEVVGRLVTALGASFSLARVGGEEFALLMPGTTAVEARRIVSEALAAVSSKEFEGVGRVTASAGVAEFGCTMNDDQLYRLADSKLYQAKTEGRNRAC